MRNMRSIEIDFDIHKMIEAERKDFSETPNDVLRRLLKIEKKPKAVNSNAGTGRPWTGKGVSLPHGTLLRAEYNGQVHEGEIKEGRWFVAGKYYTSPSGALHDVACTKGGKKPFLNGWIYWQVKRPVDVSWISIDSLRSGLSVKEMEGITLDSLGLERKTSG